MGSAVKQTALCAYNALTRRWTPLLSSPNAIKATLPPPHQHIRTPLPHRQQLALASWNINAFKSRPAARALHILDSLLSRNPAPDVIFFQEMQSDVYDYILRDPRVRHGYFVTDAIDRSAFQHVPFSTSTLLSHGRFLSTEHVGEDGTRETMRKTGRVQLLSAGRLDLPSKYNRDALFIDICDAEYQQMRLFNVHLDSLADTFLNRSEQFSILADDLCESASSRGLIAGDFNSISPQDHGLLDKSGLRDQWLVLYGGQKEGHTWGEVAEDGRWKGRKRLDKVVTRGLEASHMEILPPGKIKVPRPGQCDAEETASDHAGLLCSLQL